MKTYPSGVVVGLTDTPAPTLQRYLQRNHIIMQPCDVPSRGCGENRGFSIRRIIQIALTTELSRVGIGPARGGKAAFEFSDKGSPGRGVGELYALGTTYLIGLPTGDFKVLNVPPDLSIGDVLANETAAFIINCNNVVANVTEKLDTK